MFRDDPPFNLFTQIILKKRTDYEGYYFESFFSFNIFIKKPKHLSINQGFDKK
jgi:hypothetical protein